MDARARSLPHHEDSRGLAGTEHWTRTKRQMRFAHTAGAYGCQQRLECVKVFSGHCASVSSPATALHVSLRTMSDAALRDRTGNADVAAFI
jgi:hypothetical protein